MTPHTPTYQHLWTDTGPADTGGHSLILLFLSFFCLFSFFFFSFWVGEDLSRSLDTGEDQDELSALGLQISSSPRSPTSLRTGTGQGWDKQGDVRQTERKTEPQPITHPHRIPYYYFSGNSSDEVSRDKPFEAGKRSWVVISKKKWVRHEGCLLGSEIYDEHKARRKITNQRTGWRTDFR